MRFGKWVEAAIKCPQQAGVRKSAEGQQGGVWAKSVRKDLRKRRKALSLSPCLGSLPSGMHLSK